MRYVISASCGGEMRSDTRVSPASAVVLAMKWLSEGFKDVQIVGPKGHSHDVNSAQKRLSRGLRL